MADCMMKSPERSFGEKKEVVEKVRVTVESEEQAADIVEAFWRAMPDAEDMVRQLEQDEKPDWLQELTYGDRTLVRKGTPREGGGFIVLFMGNHNPLSVQALAWLKERGYVV